MIVDKVKVILSIFFFIFITNLNAYSVNKKKVNLRLDIIQLGVFKNIENINQINKLFPENQIVILNVSGLKKVFLPNIPKSKLSQTLYEVKKKVPDAFVLKDKSIFKSNKLRKRMQMSNKQNHIYNNDTQSLNSNTILRTRKTFF